jgi:hypothetical protein
MTMEKEFLDEIKELKKGNYKNVLNGATLKTYNDFSKEANWKDVSSISHSLLLYLFDLFETDLKKGLTMIHYLLDGYPGHKYTSLFTCMYDVITTQRMSLNVETKIDFDTLNDEAKDTLQSLIINAFFRWICVVFETYRKFLVFDLFCLKETLGKTWKIDSFYYHGSPCQMLKDHSPLQSKPLIGAFNGITRHSISHGNIFIIQNESKVHNIVVQETNANKTAFIRKEYKNLVDLHENEVPTTYVLSESMRSFILVIFEHISFKYNKLIHKYLGEITYSDPVMLQMFNNIKSGKFY